jgi:hypothetical protein
VSGSPSPIVAESMVREEWVVKAADRLMDATLERG